MIWIVIVADTPSRAQTLATALAEDERLHIVTGTDHEETIDVALAVALPPNRIPPFACPIVVLSNVPEAGLLATGKINAWLPLDSSPPEVSAALCAAACDLTVLTADQFRHWRSDAEAGERESPSYVEKLTPRELQVLRMLADGLGNKQIAGQLGLSDHTAKFHVAQILAKLGATSRTEAVTIGIRRGLVPI